MDTVYTNSLLDSICSFDRSLLEPANAQSPAALKGIAQLQRDVEKLGQGLADPEAKFWLLLRKSALLSPIKMAVDMGLFDLIHKHSQITSSELSQQTGAEEALIVRVLRILAAEGLVAEPDVQTYGPCAAGEPFTNKHHQATLSWALLFLPIAMETPAYWAKLNHRSPSTHPVDGAANGNTQHAETNGNPAEQKEPLYANPFEFHFKRPGYGLFDYTRENPDVQAMFASAMQAGRAGQRAKQAEGLTYPYAKILRESETEVAFVDVAGGHGQALKEIKDSVAAQTIKGKWVLQDLQAALAEMKEGIDGVEVMPTDIFNEQPVNGAAVYHLRRVLHDWDDAKSRDILKHVVAAMDKDKSRVLIVDVVLPDKDVSMIDALGDHSMMVFGGMERSKRQWEQLAASVGLRVGEIWQGAQREAVVECFKA